MEKLFISLAYKYVALALMMTEANYQMAKLDPQGWQPVTATNIVQYHIAPPRLLLGGSFDTTEYSFGFGDDGQLQFIQVLHQDPDVSIKERHDRWTKMKSEVSTNDACRLAKTWLEELEVDLPALERIHPLYVSQRHYFPGGLGTNHRSMLPCYDIMWGASESQPAVWVTVFSPAKSPLQIRIRDTLFLKRPRGLVKNPEKLLAIPDREFASYSLIEKSNLVFQAVLYPYPKIDLAEELFSGRPQGRNLEPGSLPPQPTPAAPNSK